MVRRTGGKRLVNCYRGIEREKRYSLREAVIVVQRVASVKFDETVELSLNLNVDPRHADQMVRGVVSLPHGIGRSVRVAVFAKDSQADEARVAGADVVGAEDLADKVRQGEIDFDRCIATPDLMSIVGRLGKILGPRGMMPNPKLGTVTLKVADAVAAVKAGQVEYRAERAGIIHAGVGKVSFSEEQIIENVCALVGAVLKAKPPAVKGTYMKSAALSSTMGPSVRVDTQSFATA